MAEEGMNYEAQPKPSQQQQPNKMRMNDNTLTKEEQRELLRSILPACQPQEGSPANTFTRAELDDLKTAFPRMEIVNGDDSNKKIQQQQESKKMDILKQWGQEEEVVVEEEASPPSTFCPPPQDGEKTPSQGDLVKQSSESVLVSGDYSSPPPPPQDGSDDTTLLPPQDGDETIMYTPPPPPPQDGSSFDEVNNNQEGDADDFAVSPPPQDGSFDEEVNNPQEEEAADWHGAPRFHKDASLAQAFREQVRKGGFTGPTNGICPGFLQCNLVVLPQGPVAFDFLLFCQRNPKACPLIDVCDVGSPHAPGVAKGADLRTDVPKYAIYRNGKLEKEVSDATEYWPEQSVAFLIGCSFSYDGALMDAGIPLKSAQQGKNVPMYKTNLKCRPSGCLQGKMVVSMKPIPALQVSKHIEITSKYTHAHGGPVAVGSAAAIGINDIDKPEWGDAIDIGPTDVPIFHACGVTPQSILMESKVPFAITHSAGHMFVTDLPSDMGL